MKTKAMISALFFSVLFSSASYAVNVTCYGMTAPDQIGCFVFLYSHEITNSHNGVFSTLYWEGLRSPYLINSQGVNSKPSNTTTPSHHWHTESPTTSGEWIQTWAAQVNGWDEEGDGPSSFDYIDHDTQDFDSTGIL